MDCEKCKQLLNPYLDGELEGSEFAEIEHHLEKCPDCTAELDRLVRMRDLLRELRAVEVPEGEREVFINALRERLEAEGIPSPARKRDPRPVMVAAIAFVLALVLLVSLPRGDQTPKIAPAPGLNAFQNAAFDAMIVGALDNHILATSGDFMADPAATGGQAIAVWKVVRSTHNDIFEPAGK